MLCFLVHKVPVQQPLFFAYQQVQGANSNISSISYQQDWRQDPTLSARSILRASTANPALDDTTVMHLAHLLSQQERRFGVNMYDALRPEDDPDLQTLMASGLTQEQAVLQVFERHYDHTGDAERPPHLPHHHHRHHHHHTSPESSQYPISLDNEDNGRGRDGVSPELAASTQTAADEGAEHQKEHKKLAPKSSFRGLIDTITQSFHFPHAHDEGGDEKEGHEYRDSDLEPARGNGEEDEAYAALNYRTSDVRVLRDMGYSKEQAVAALLQSNNNVPLAIDALCQSEHPTSG